MWRAIIILLLCAVSVAAAPETTHAPLDVGAKLEETQQFCLDAALEAQQTAEKRVYEAEDRLVDRFNSEIRQFKFIIALMIFGAVYSGFTLADIMRYRREKRRLKARLIRGESQGSPHLHGSANPVIIKGKWLFFAALLFFAAGLGLWGWLLFGNA